MKEFFQKLQRLLERHPKTKRTIGILLILIGVISIITPFTPVGFLLIIGLEMLGMRFLLWDKIKSRLRRQK